MATDKPTLLTVEGKRKLEEELHYLKTVRRAQVAERIRLAKEEGDLRENAEYDDAKMEQGFVEGRIRELEALLQHVQIIDSVNGNNVVTIGSTVSICEQDEESDEVFTVVGSAEADPSKGLISNESPLGRKLLGRKKGDVVEVDTPGGRLTFKILDIR